MPIWLWFSYLTPWLDSRMSGFYTQSNIMNHKPLHSKCNFTFNDHHISSLFKKDSVALCICNNSWNRAFSLQSILIVCQSSRKEWVEKKNFAPWWASQRRKEITEQRNSSEPHIIQKWNWMCYFICHYRYCWVRDCLFQCPTFAIAPQTKLCWWNKVTRWHNGISHQKNELVRWMDECITLCMGRGRN